MATILKCIGLIILAGVLLLASPSAGLDCRAVMKGVPAPRNRGTYIAASVKCDGHHLWEQTTPAGRASEVRLPSGLKVFGKWGHGVGILLIDNASINLVDSHFEDLPPDIQSGPVLAPVVIGGSIAEIRNVTIRKQRTGQVAGGIYVTKGSIVTIEDSLLEDNVGAGVGGLAVSEGSSAQIKNCRFRKNSAPGWAGSVLIKQSSDLTVLNSTFDGTQSPPSVSDVAELRLVLIGQFRDDDLPDVKANLLPVAGAIFASDGSTISVQKTTFHGYSAQQGTLHFTKNCRADLLETNFTDNFVRSGAAVYLEDSEVHLNNCHFSGNMATMGGAVGVTGAGSLTTINSTFEQNTALSSGGAVFVNSTVFGEGCHGVGAVVKLHSSTFYGNEAKHHGGALSAVCPKSVSISESWFEENTAGEKGGALHVFSADAVSMDSTFLLRNRASEGGAASIGNCDSASLESVSYLSNLAKVGLGAGVMVTDVPKITVRDSVFQFNVAVGSGSALAMLRGKTASISDCKFHFNQADNNGGGVLASSLLSLEVENVTVYNNVATGNGGGFHAEDVAAAKFISSVFDHNKAEQDGGAISFKSLTKGYDFSAKECSFNENSAHTGGAANFDLAGSVELTNSNFSLNTARAMGGGVAAVETDRVVVHNTRFTANKADTLTEGAGGAIYHSGSRLELQDAVLESNRAARQGGAVVSANASYANLTSCSFLENTVTGIGGALALSGSENAILYLTDFESNSAGGLLPTGRSTNSAGGAVHATSVGRLNVQDCSFNENQALGKGEARGGAIHVVEGLAFWLDSVNFTNNTSGGSGGALSMEYVQTLDFHRGHFLRNEADAGAGVVVEGVTNMTGLNLTFILNTANTSGGALLCQGPSTISVQHSNFSGDSAKYGNGLVAGCNCSMTISSSFLTEEAPVYKNNTEGSDTCSGKVETPETEYLFNRPLAQVRIDEEQKNEDAGLIAYFGNNSDLIKLLSAEIPPDEQKKAEIKTAVVVSIAVLSFVVLVAVCVGAVALGKWVVTTPGYKEYSDSEDGDNDVPEVLPEDSASPSAPLLQNLASSPPVDFEGDTTSIPVDREPVDSNPQNFGQSTEDYVRDSEVKPSFAPEPVTRSSEVPVPPLTPVPPLFGPGLKDSEIQEV